MRQLLQHLGDGRTLLVTAPAPGPRPGALLIQTSRSLVSAGGDDLFTGYRRHQALRVDGLIRRIPLPLRRMVKSLLGSLRPTTGWGRRAVRFSRGMNEPMDERIEQYFRWMDRANVTGLLQPDFAGTSTETRSPLLSHLDQLSAGVTDLQKMLALEQRFFLADHNLVYTDKMSMAAGVEVRVPFLDLELQTFANRLPDGAKLRRGTTKWVLKKALEPELPRHVVHRKKTGFGAPLRSWINGPLRPALLEYLGEASLRRRGIFEPRTVTALIEANARGQTDASYTLYTMLAVEIWCRKFVDSQG